MVTTHEAGFLRDPRFESAYAAGASTGSWHGTQLRWRVYTCCWAAHHALHLRGDFVECGVNRGGISRAVMEYVDFGKTNERVFWLLDTFRGDPDVAGVNQSDYSECYDDVVRTFSSFPNVRIVRGRVPETLSRVTSERLSYVSIDLNSAQPSLEVLRHFWERLVPGAAVVLDDYAYSRHYRDQKEGFDALGVELGFAVLTLPTGQGIIIKS